MQCIRQNWDHVRQKRGGAKRSVSDAEAELRRTWVCVGWSFVRCCSVASWRSWLGKVGGFAEQGTCQSQGSRLVCRDVFPSAKSAVCQPQGRKVGVAKLGNNQRYNSVRWRFQRSLPTARSQGLRGRMARFASQGRSQARSDAGKVGKVCVARSVAGKVGRRQGWQGLSRKVARSDWMFARSQGRTQEALPMEGRHPTFVAFLMTTLHPHADLRD